MKSEVKIVLRRDLDFEKVRYYTLKFDDDKHELEKFYENYQEEYSRSIDYIKMWLAVIGEKFGAESKYFRPEDNAKALPPPSPLIKQLEKEVEQEKMCLRLYCIVLSPEIVILVNGGIKESDATRHSPTCEEQFQFASNIASQIERMLKLGHLQIKGKMLKRSKSFKLTYKR